MSEIRNRKSRAPFNLRPRTSDPLTSVLSALILFSLKAHGDRNTMPQMKKTMAVLFTCLVLIPLAAFALEATSPGVRGNRKDATTPSAASPSVDSKQGLTIDFWHQSPMSSLGLVDAITGTVTWQPLQKFRASGSPDAFFPCRFTFRCSIDNRIIKYCNVMTDNRGAYRMNIDLDGFVHVSVDGPGRQSVSFDAEGLRKRIHVYGRSTANEASCGIEP
jgi:hypothetical protein